MTCDFCYTNGHDVLDCQNIDPEQLAIEIAARDHRTTAHLVLTDAIAISAVRRTSGLRHRPASGHEEDL